MSDSERYIHDASSTYCDLSGCGTWVENIHEDGFQIVTPEDISSLGASVYCSSRCAKIAMKRYGEDGGSA